MRVKKILKSIVPQNLRDCFRQLQAIIYLLSEKQVNKNLGIFDEYWEKRIKLTQLCPDNLKLNHVNEAGKIKGNKIIMFNGVEVFANSYYQGRGLNLLLKNKGSHEPQEEILFEELISGLGASPTMIEVGSYWAFYSLSFLKKCPSGKVFLIEPGNEELVSGKLNFFINKKKASFNRYFVTCRTDLTKKHITLDDFLLIKKIPRVTILHADIQGEEINLLLGAQKTLTNKIVDYIFISTHSDDLHQMCLKKIRNYDYDVLTEYSCRQSYSEDGLVFAKSTSVNYTVRTEITKRLN